MTTTAFMKTFIAAVALTMTASAAQKTATYPQKERTFHSAADFARLTGGKLRVERTADEVRLNALRRAIPSWPVADVTVLGPDSGSALWVGTRRGAIRYSDGYRRHEYLAGLRWLPDDQ